ncbi:MAG: aldo/keto reductase [Actinobacteria bacterium]|nr:aldo/keto reductase [Actinomycetota bacterium]
MEENLVSDANRRLGEDVEIGPIGFGCWRLTGTSDSDNGRLIATALDLGINLIDNSDVYGLDWGGTGFGACEEALGRVLATDPSLRDRMVLATKGGIIPGVPYDSSGAYLISACEASLRRMGVDHVDLYQIHRPDMFTHPEEIAVAFASLRDRGLVSMFGVSNYTPSQTIALATYVEEPLVSTQPEFSCAALAPMRDGTFDLCMEEGITPLAWSPLAGGRLASGEGVRPELVSVLDELAAREGVSRAAVAIAFVLAHPADAVALVGTQRAERLGDLASAVRVALSRTDVYRVVVASEGAPLP